MRQGLPGRWRLVRVPLPLLLSCGAQMSAEKRLERKKEEAELWLELLHTADLATTTKIPSEYEIAQLRMAVQALKKAR